MGMRQPLGTRSLFLYLEDGMQFEHQVCSITTPDGNKYGSCKKYRDNKGLGSSLYGGETIRGAVNDNGGSNRCSTLKLSAQLNDIGYKRADLQTGFTKGKWGVSLSGYYASRKRLY
jgi:hypothetical protein